MIRKICFVVLTTCLAVPAAVGFEVTGLRVNHEEQPLGVDDDRPVFGWMMSDDRPGAGQCAYEITVTDESGRCVWSSGRQESAESANVRYAGRSLEPTVRYGWEVRVWNDAGEESASSSWFETGLRGDIDSSVKWIGGGEDDMTLYPHYLPVFGLDFDVTISPGSSRAAVLYGVNDRRLLDRNKNIYHIANPRDSSMVKVELDISGVASGRGAAVNLYRRGYSPADSVYGRPMHTMQIPLSVIGADNCNGCHTVSLMSVLGYTTVTVDGAAVGEVNVNPVGRGGDYIAFPVVGDMGLSVPAGETAEFLRLDIRNFRNPSNVIQRVISVPERVSGCTRIFTVGGKASPMLRSEFTSHDAKVTKARVYATARGAYDLYMNGIRVNDTYLNPGLTEYNRTHTYQVYDVTDIIVPGDNAIGAVLAEGWWSGGASFVGENWNYYGDRQSLWAKLVIDYADGTTVTVVTDPATWRYCDHGPVLYGSLFQGEVYDARREDAVDGWASAGYDDSGWHAAVEVAVPGFEDTRLTGRYGQPVMAVDTLTALSVVEARPGVYVYDMGQNMAGVPSVRLTGMEPGREVCLRFAEILYPDMPQYSGHEGMLMLENIRAAMAQDIYITRGGEELMSPRFTYHGFRYVEITGIDAPLPIENVKAVVLSSLDKVNAGYVTSNDDVNRLWQNIVWSSRANFFSIPTDCPQRNERMGWTGDISVFAPTALYMGDMYQFLRRYLQSMRDTQRPDGRFLEVVPMSGGFGGLLWGSAGITVPWECYRYTADESVLHEHYDAMRRYMDYVAANDIDPVSGLIVQKRQWGDLGDWLGLEYDKADKSLFWEAYYIYDLGIMAKVAELLGHAADARRYESLRQRRIDLFNRVYIDPVTVRTVYSSFVPEKEGLPLDLQATYAVPLALGAVKEEYRERFVKNFVRTVERVNTTDRGDRCPPYSLMTGFIGTAWINDALSDCGHSDLAYRLLQQTSFPSWLYPVRQGATTVWERLNSFTLTDGFGGNNSMNSFNHYSFGAVGEWMIGHSLGIRLDRSVAGFRRFVLSPEIDPTGEMTSAGGWYDSPYGRIESAWRVTGDEVEYRFRVPANTVAEMSVAVPGGTVTQTLRPGTYEFTYPKP